jgi:hypothetical protein
MFTNNNYRVVGVITLALVLVACNQQSTVPMKTLTPKASAQKAIDQYDTNQDGVLELEECSPALNALFTTGDEDENGVLTVAEIQARLQFHDDRQVGLITAAAYLVSTQTAVKGIAIKLIPDPIFTGIPPANGVADSIGFVIFQTQGEALSGVCPGLYSIAITDDDGTRTLKQGIEIGLTANRGTPKINIDN